jgi:uncharacterized membrane protein
MSDHSLSDHPHPDDPLSKPLFAATLRPHRSLKLEGYRLVMALVVIASLIASIPFIVLGFWPVAGFYGLDVLLLYWAFKANFAAAKAYEEVRVSPLELFLKKVSAEGDTTEWRFNPIWTRVHRDEHAEFGVERVWVASRGQSVTIGRFLPREDMAHLSDRLTDALRQARSGHVFNP